MKLFCLLCLALWTRPVSAANTGTCVVGGNLVCCPGYYYTRTPTTCTICPQGYSCAGGLITSGVPCANGTFAASTGLSACTQVTVCTSNQYEAVAPSSSRDRSCRNYTTCPVENWLKGWSATTDGVCTQCAKCEVGYSATKVCTQFQDRVCVHQDCDANTNCGSMFCNYGTSSQPCNMQWSSNGVGISLDPLCKRSTTMGVCTNCPVGWTTSGGYCNPCTMGSSCDVFGVASPSCGGTCSAGKLTRCNSVTGRVDCTASCAVNSTAAALGNYQVYRGGVIDRTDLCDTYFKCNIGYYTMSSALDSQGMSYPTCLPCMTRFVQSSQYEPVSAGLAYGDPYSCLYRSMSVYPAANTIGTYGAAPFTLCPSNTTSNAKMALNISGCEPCRLIPPHAIVDPLSTTCAPVCADGFTLLGHACVNPQSVPCTDPGYFLSKQNSQGQVCKVSPLPWNGVGNQSTGSVWVSRQNHSMRVVAYDAAGKVGTDGTQLFTGVGWLPLCNPLSVVITYVLDVPLSALTCDQIEYHRFYMVKQAQGMLLGFLERTFGFNNRFVLWGVDTSGNIVMRWILPGKVCSATTSVLNGVEYLYMHFCKTSFVAFIRIKVNEGWFLYTYSTQKFTTLGFNATVLIGGHTPGKADGLRDTALFGSSLSLAVGSDPSRLFVADSDNCRIVEVWIDSPGSFMTSARTVRASCYDPAKAIPSPRLLTSVLGGRFLLFITDLGLFQMDLTLRSFVLVVEADLLPDSPFAMGADADHIWVWNATTNTTYRDDQLPCPAGMSSVEGRLCSYCASDQYTPEDPHVCTDCTHVPWCPPGTTLQLCTPTNNAFCAPCGEPPKYNFSYVSGCFTVMIPPCEPGWYGVSNCTPCPPFSTTRFPSAISVVACACQYGGTYNIQTNTCTTPSPFADAQAPAYDIAQLPSWLEPLGCKDVSGAACAQCRGSIDSNCLPCGSNGLYLQHVNPRVCRACPEGKVGLNGLWCQACPSLQTPNPQGTACLCKAHAVVGGDGVSCVCSAGYEEQSGECAACRPGYFSSGQGQACVRCPPGSDSKAEAAVCTPCAKGLYQDGATTLGCTPCPGSNAYALDSGSKDSCTACQASCPGGTSAVPCTGTGWACLPCNTTLDPASQHWIAGEGYPDCLWGCNQGFFLSQDACVPCTHLTGCPAGFALNACTPYADASCGTPCKNETMPGENAVWGDGCAWACEEGYHIVTKTFMGWTEYACELKDSRQWMSWLFY